MGPSILPEKEWANNTTSSKVFNKRVEFEKFKTILGCSRKTHVLTMRRNLESISTFI